MTADSSQPFQSNSVSHLPGELSKNAPRTAHAAAQAVLSTSGAVRIRYTRPQPWMTPLVQLRDRHVSYTAIVPLTEIPAAWHRGLQAYARHHEGRCFDPSTTGHYLLPAWRMFLSDPTPEAVVAALREHGAEDGYPYRAWRNTGLTHLTDYLDVLQALRFLACVLPEGTLAWHRLAIFMRPARH